MINIKVFLKRMNKFIHIGLENFNDYINISGHSRNSIKICSKRTR